jgi:hypothetical protein
MRAVCYIGPWYEGSPPSVGTKLTLFEIGVTKGFLGVHLWDISVLQMLTNKYMPPVCCNQTSRLAFFHMNSPLNVH